MFTLRPYGALLPARPVPINISPLRGYRLQCFTQTFCAKPEYAIFHKSCSHRIVIFDYLRLRITSDDTYKKITYLK